MNEYETEHTRVRVQISTSMSHYLFASARCQHYKHLIKKGFSGKKNKEKRVVNYMKFLENFLC